MDKVKTITYYDIYVLYRSSYRRNVWILLNDFYKSKTLEDAKHIIKMYNNHGIKQFKIVEVTKIDKEVYRE